MTLTITPADLLLPGDVLGGAVLKGWADPTRDLLRRMVTVHPDDLAPSVRRLRATWLDSGADRVDEHDCTRREVRSRLFWVLGEGERCPASLISQHCDEGCECDGTAWKRPPHNLLWLLDAEAKGTISPLVAAALWWCSILRVEAGLAPCSVYGRWLGHGSTADVPWTRDRLNSPTGAFARAQADERPTVDRDLLFRGGALLNADHILLPHPDGPVRLNLTETTP